MSDKNIWDKILLDMYNDGLVTDTPFDINLPLIRDFMRRYSEECGSGNYGSKSNTMFAAKLAALTFCKFKNSVGLPIPEGFIYIISNPAWSGWYKVGMSHNPKKRLGAYQTYSPYRDYKLDHWSFWENRREGEKLVLRNFGDTKGEWTKQPIKNIQDLATTAIQLSSLSKL
jgi:hypothetical protein